MPILKDYQAELRRFMTGQHLNTGVRVTAAVIAPAWILYHFGVLGSMVSFPLGALFVGLTDNPGPIHHRRNGMIISATLNFFVAVIAGLSRSNDILVGGELVFFGLACSIVSIYGLRASSIGLTALIIFILSSNSPLPPDHIFQTGFYYFAGGLWYMLISLSIATLRPYRPVQQLLGECLMKTSSYLSTKGLFYNKDADSSQILGNLIDQQIDIHQYQEQLRNMLFTTRRFLSESTYKGRILTMMFRDSIDLFERAVATHHEYKYLHEQFDKTGILFTFQKAIQAMSVILYNIGLAVQEGNSLKDEESINALIKESNDAFNKLRKEEMNAANVEAFIKLRHVLYSIQNVSERIKKMMLYTTYEKSLSEGFKSDVDFSKFPTRQKINFNLLISNISFKSSAFRHAFRLAIALLAGYIISLFFAIGHGYWILLTIATILKPAYSLSKQRNVQRLAGTFVGVATGFGILHFSHNNTVIFVSMITVMVLAYSLLKINYTVSIACITVYLLLSFHFLYPQGLTTLLTDRIIDTVIGCAIAYLVSYFVLPSWEYQQIDRPLDNAIEKQRTYFNTVAGVFAGAVPSSTDYKLARKEAFVSLANLSDSFQRMVSDPKQRQPNLPLYHQFVSADHLLASHIASLSDYAQRYGSLHANADFQPIISLIDKQFINTGQEQQQLNEDLQSIPVYKRVNRLLEQRKKDIESLGLEGTPSDARKTLGELVRITDQFRLIWATAKEAMKIAREIKEKRD